MTQRLLPPEPPTPGTTHRWIHRALCRVFRLAPDTPDDQAVSMVASCFSDGGTPERRSEIRASVGNARRFIASLPAAARAHGPADRWHPLAAPPAPVEVPPRLPRAVVNPLLCDLARQQMPHAFEKFGCGTKRAESLPPDRLAAARVVVGTLYSPEDLVCAGQTLQEMSTRTLATWGDELLACQHVVPSPMSAPMGRTKAGRESPRTLENAAVRRRFLVVEFDGPSLEQQASRLGWLAHHLGTRTPGALVVVVHSGNKSLHGWFHVERVRTPTVLAFWRLALTLGADPQMWQPHQPARFPLGLRADNGRVQEVLWWCPPIFDTRKQNAPAAEATGAR
jgi:hypothetical protein